MVIFWAHTVLFRANMGKYGGIFGKYGGILCKYGGILSTFLRLLVQRNIYVFRIQFCQSCTSNYH